jgi:hypothetical protein
VRPGPSLLLSAVLATVACRLLSSGLPSQDAGQTPTGADAGHGSADVLGLLGTGSVDVGEPAGIEGVPPIAGCSDGTREGYPNFTAWQRIAGCAGGFSVPGVLGAQPTCDRKAGDTSDNPMGAGCSAADLCAAGWHVCQDAADAAAHCPTADCEGCVSRGEPRFFAVAGGASPMGMCTQDPAAKNDLHGCGGLGEPESPYCSPLTRRLGFADCLATHGVWQCGSAGQSLEEAAVVTKTGPTLGGVLCCMDQ